ncbi:MAG: glycosyltransferase 87 family protein, partial [Candidatus Bathyarchaeia archaeon]
MSPRRGGKLSVLLVASFVSRFLFFLLGIERARIGFSLPISGAWEDYACAYIPTVQAFTSGNLPYKDFFHAYPPLFLYALTVFSILPYFWSMALPLVVSDALTVIPVYLIGKRLSSEHKAFLASLLFALAPINLFYVDYVWLNPPLTTLFLLVSLYYLLEGRYDMSAITIAVSIGFKQTSLLALPIMLFFAMKRTSHKHVLRYFMIVASVCFAFSIPYIFLEPRLYLFSVFRVPISALGDLPENYFQLGFTKPPGSGTVDVATLEWYELKWMKYAPLNAPASLSLPIFIFLLPETASGIYFIANLTLKILLLTAYGILLYKTHRREQIQDKVWIKCVLYSLLILFTFNPVYKYYVAGITPFLALLGQKRRGFIAFEAFNMALLAIPRLLTSYLLL